MTHQATSPTRRTVLAAGAFGAVGVVAGCQSYGGNQAAAPPADDDADDDGAASGREENAADGGGNDDGGGGGDEIANAADVAVGGGLILGDQQVVITQPSQGEFKGFSAICTHQGCTVAEVSDGTINCPCHGSRFSIEDGSVVQAASGLSPDQQDPLPPVAINVDGDSIQAA